MRLDAFAEIDNIGGRVYIVDCYLFYQPKFEQMLKGLMTF